MNLLKKLPTRRDVQPHCAYQTQSTTRPKAAQAFLRLAIPGVMAAALLNVSPGIHAFAQSTAQANSQEAPAIDPAAMDALNKMGAYLRTLNAFQVKAAITTDDVTEDGETIESSSKINLLAVRPDKLRVERTTDDQHQILFFDGKHFTIYGLITNYYATVPMPGTISELIDKVSDKYGIELPLVDLFRWGTNDTTIKRVLSAKDIGPTSVNGITCEQYAFHQKAIDWQIWIQLGDYPLPLKLVIRTLTDDARPQHSEILTWNLAPSYSDSAFTFDPPPGAQRISIAEIDSKPAEKAK